MAHSHHTAREEGGDREGASALGDEEPPSIEGRDERSLLAAVVRSLKAWGHSLDHSDDCALLAPLPRPQLVTTDALAEGVHFDLSWDSFEQVGAQAAVVNLSDLAASGGRPQALIWSLSLPPTLSVAEVESLSWGFARVAARWEAPVVGGNLCVRPGPLELHVTALGAVPHQRLHRRGARHGDGVFVTGPLGARALGYLEPSEAARALRHQWRPHLQESAALSAWGEVTAMMDISDGLLLDAQRLAEASEVTLHLETPLLPVCARMSALASSQEVALRAALSGGEDYVLLLTSPSHPPPEVNATRVGRVERAGRAGAPRLTLDGAPASPLGYQHALRAPLSSPLHP
jgi:thiamine-monophosphate kinase